jgi:hypothetical protein
MLAEVFSRFGRDRVLVQELRELTMANESQVEVFPNDLTLCHGDMSHTEINLNPDLIPNTIIIEWSTTDGHYTLRRHPRTMIPCQNAWRKTTAVGLRQNY